MLIFVWPWERVLGFFVNSLIQARLCCRKINSNILVARVPISPIDYDIEEVVIRAQYINR
jgi:hypothetical protein